MKDTIEWAAGLFEGEGNIYRNDPRRIFVMSVKMKDEDIIKRFHKAVDCGRICKRKPVKDYACMWEWVLTKTNDILRLTKRLLPYMGKRRTILILKALKGKVFVEERQCLKEVPECGHMEKGEISSRGAKQHVRKGEKPCSTCAENQRLYLRKWRKTFFEANP